MLRLIGNEDFYPTPDSLLEQILDGLDWEKVNYVLEPSAGKGNIAEFVIKAKKKWHYDGFYRSEKVDVDCIEIQPELRAILKDKKFRVVHDDFLTFHTYKHYDLIVMNPPFSSGARHLLKAIEVQKTTGGGIICLLNAETIRNPYTNERKDLAQKLKEYGAEIAYYENAFSTAENSTDIEVACVKLEVPEPERKTTIFDTLREKEYEEFEKKRESSELAESDLVAAFVAQYNREIEWGLRLYDELLELNAKSLDGKSHLHLEIGEYTTTAFSVNEYVYEVRRKYWGKFFKHPMFYSRLTTNLANQYTRQVNRFAEYDFSYWNIKTVQEEIARRLIKGVEDCIVSMFDELSRKHSYSGDLFEENIHYYNGWKSNIAWKINKRVIIPVSGFHERWDKIKEFDPFQGGAYDKLDDLEKVLNYLDNGETTEIDITSRLRWAQSHGRTKNLRLKYFDVTFYKKGTCHVTFTNERLLKKFNIFGSQRKGWLPKGYAKKKYDEFDTEEQAVIESFEGRNAYEQTQQEAQYFLFNTSKGIPQLT